MESSFLNISMNCSSAFDESVPWETAVGNLGNKQRELLLLSGLDVHLLPDSDEVNQLFAGKEKFIEWFMTSLRADNIVSEEEIQDYEHSKETLPEENEVDKLLQGKFGLQNNCVRLCDRILEKKLNQETLLRSKIDFITSANCALNKKVKMLETNNASLVIKLENFEQERANLKSDCQNLIEEIRSSVQFFNETKSPPLSVLYMEKMQGSDFKDCTEEAVLDVYNELQPLLDSIKIHLFEVIKVFVILSSSSRSDSLLVDKCASEKTLSVLESLEHALAKLLPYLDYRGYILKEMFLRILSTASTCCTTKKNTVFDVINVKNAVSNQKESANLSDFLFSIHKNLVRSDEVVTVDVLVSALTSADLEIRDGQILLDNYLQHLNEKLVAIINSMENLGYEFLKQSEEYKISELNLLKQNIVSLYHLISSVTNNKKKKWCRLKQCLWLCLHNYENYLSVMNEMQSKIKILHKAVDARK